MPTNAPAKTPRKLLAKAMFILAALVMAASTADSSDRHVIHFKDTEYGFNHERDYTIWQKPITAAQAARIKRATVGYVEVPEDMQQANSGYREMRKPMTRSKGPHPDVWVISYQMKPPYGLERLALVVKPADIVVRSLVRHEDKRFVYDPNVPIKTKRWPYQTWDVYLVIAGGYPLRGRKSDEWVEFWRRKGKPEGFGNFRNGWSVTLEYD